MRKLLFGFSLIALATILLNTWNSHEQPAEIVENKASSKESSSCECLHDDTEQHATPSPVEAPSTATLQPFQEFNQWHSAWQNTAPENRSKLLPRGISIARARSKALSKLIEENPDAALAQTLPLTTYATLPQEIASITEQPITQVVETRVLPNCSGEEHAGLYLDYPAKQDGTKDSEKAHTSSTHPAALSKTRTPVLAYRLDGKSLLASSPLYQLQPQEITGDTIAYIDPVNGEPAQPHLRAIIAGKTFGFSTQENIHALRDAITTAEEAFAPNSMEYFVDAMTNGDSLEPATIVRMAMMVANSWTTGAKSTLIIRVQFGDIAATSANSWSHASSYLQATLDNSVETAIDAMSYGKSTLTAEASTGLYTIGNWTGNYANQANPEYSILNAARAQATAAGYNLNNYDIVGVCFPELNHFSWVGLATTGGTNLWLNGYTSTRTIVHALGHNYGVRHAGPWRVNGSSEPHSASGSFVEYGDIFDAMGSSFSATNDFNMLFKHKLNWLEASNTVDLKSASVGTYRIYRFDDKNVDLTSNRKFVINAQLTTSPDLWIGYRKNAFQISPYNLHNGAHVIWDNPADAGHSRLLDMTPDSQTSNDHQDKKDSALVVGQSYTFPGPLKLEVLSQGGTAPHEYIDVKVTLGTPGNSAPTLTSITPGTITAFKAITFISDAADIDDDTLSYSWDFGDNSRISSSTSTAATPTKIYTAAGTYTVSLTVGDGQGNFTTHSRQVTVTSPLTSWTKLSTSTTATLNGINLVNGKLILTGNSSLLRSSQDGGDNWTTHSLPHACELQEATYYNGAYHIVGQAFINSAWRSVIYRSTDLTTFTNVAPSSSFNTLYTVANSGTNIVAAGQNGTVLHSTDGMSWSAQSSGTSFNLNEAAYNGNRFRIVGGNGSFNGDSNSINSVAIQSTNGGTAWSVHNPFSTSRQTSYSLLAHGSDFITSGTHTFIPYTTSSGANWAGSSFLAQSYITGLSYGQNIYLATGLGLELNFAVSFHNYFIENDYAAVSLNGRDWDILTSPTGQKTTPVDNAYAHGYFFIVGANGNLWRSGLVDSYDKWAGSNIPAGEITTATADIDSDNLSNQMEFALGTNPATHTTNPVSLDLTGAKAKVTISKNALVSSGFTYQLQRSTNLADWDTVGTTVVTDTATMLEIESTSNTSSTPNEFYRLIINAKP